MLLSTPRSYETAGGASRAVSSGPSLTCQTSMVVWLLSTRRRCHPPSTHMKSKRQAAGRKMNDILPMATHRVMSELARVSTPRIMPCTMHSRNGGQLTVAPYRQPAQTPASQRTKKRSFRRPIQQLVNGLQHPARHASAPLTLSGHQGRPRQTLPVVIHAQHTPPADAAMV